METLRKDEIKKIDSIIDIDSTEQRLDIDIFNNLMKTKINRNLLVKYILFRLRQLERDN